MQSSHTSSEISVQPRTHGRRIPSSTYRLQFNQQFTFQEATQIIPYLHALGISDCYSSPYLKAMPGSLHGYDVIDHNALNPEIGSEADYEEFVAALQRHEMGQLVDIVPNHMGISGKQNPWWADVLENGPSSPYATFFDIDWTPLKPELVNKVLLPVLMDQYGCALENQDLALAYDTGVVSLSVYGSMQLPVAPRPLTLLFSHRLPELEQLLGTDHPASIELQSIITALSHLPLRTETDPEKVRERQREKEVIKRRLAALTAEHEAVHDFLAENIRIFNGTKEDRRSFDLLDTLLDEQVYRLAYWRVAAEEINYRRFFDINDLAALRTEELAVFAATHQLILQLFAAGKISGFRIDHIDGLFNPSQYLRRLQRASHIVRNGGEPTQLVSLLQEQEGARSDGASTDEAMGTSQEKSCYLVAEKILAPEEHLPEDWPLDGTSGYDFLPLLNGLFVDPRGERPCTEIYARFIGTRPRFADLAYDCKKLIMQVALSSELNVLAHQLSRIAARDRHSRDFTLNSLRHAVREIVACFPVYRTYIHHSGVTNTDRAIIEQAVKRARRRNPATDASVFNFVRNVLLLHLPATSDDDLRLAYLAFVMKFQQYTGPVTAKGLEDTAFYRYHRLVSLNEVGGTPDRFGTPLATFHEHNRYRSQHWPHSLVATSTHDTKRSEDVRARINVISELPQVWRGVLGRWEKLNRKKKLRVDGEPAPDRNDEYLLYQTLIGAWPLESLTDDTHATFTQRIQEYMRKATKEAKVNTSWLNPNQAYDEAVQHFVKAVLDDPAFVQAGLALREMVAVYGMYNALAQTVVKLTVPGVPDLYQGNELWDFSLVDPDNRRPVDYRRRQTLLTELRMQVEAPEPPLRQLAQSLVKTWQDGRIKLFVTYRILTYRREHPELFQHGTYLPLEVLGTAQQHVCVFMRQHGRDTIIVVVPRLVASLLADVQTAPLGSQVWKDTSVVLPGGGTDQYYCNLFTGERIHPVEQSEQTRLPLAAVLADFPVAILSTAP